MVKFTLSLISVLIVGFQVLFAQENRDIVTQPIQWVTLNSNLSFGKRICLLLEGQFRQAQNLEPQQYQLRTALDVKITEHLSIAPLGYVYTWNYKYGKQPAAFENNEHRIFQQVSYKHLIGVVKMDHRLRMEERFIQNHSIGNSGSVVDEGYVVRQNRLRYRLMARVPLNSRKIEPHTYFLSAYDEIFVSWGDKITFHEPDQNRLFMGVGYQFDKSFTLQGGFIYQLLLKANGTMQENNIGIQLQLAYNIDLAKGH